MILRVQPAGDAGILGIRHGEAPLRIDGHIAGQGDRGHSGGQAAVGAPALEGVAISGRHIRGQIDDGAAALADGADLRAAVGVEGQLVGSTDGAAATGNKYCLPDKITAHLFVKLYLVTGEQVVNINISYLAHRCAVV